MAEGDRKYHTGNGGRGCPWCAMPPVEHETRDGHLHRIYLCPRSPRGWVGVFTDQPVSQLVTKGKGAE